MKKKELYKSMGFHMNPFSNFSAEEELDYLNEIFVQPRYYDTLFSDLLNGNSKIILGARGVGKSTLIYQLHNQLLNNKSLSIVIDDYEGISLQKNENDIIQKIIKAIVNRIVITIAKNPHLLKCLDKYDKEKLAFYIRDFFETISKKEYQRTYDSITHYKAKNFLKNIYNYLFHKPLNIALNASVQIASDTISKSFGLDKIDLQNFEKNYIPAIEIEIANPKSGRETEIKNYKYLKEILQGLIDLVKKVNFKGIVIFFDRIDEFRLLEGKISNIVKFTESLLKDTSLLYQKDLALVFCIWNEVKPHLDNIGIRFDKFKPIDISWTHEDLIQIIDKRLKYFSRDQNKTIRNLIEGSNHIEYTIDLANNSPRDLLRLLSHIYEEQSIKNSSNKQFHKKALHEGKLKFIKNYDYYSVYSSRKGTKEDIVNNLTKLLRIGKKQFSIKDMVSSLKVSSQTAKSYLRIMKNYGLVRDNDENTGTAKSYIVIDPKVSFLILCKIINLQDIKN